MRRISKYTIALLFAICSSAAHAADDGVHHGGGHKKVAMFVGAGEEENAQGGRHSAKAIGLEFEYGLNGKWAVGGVIEHLEVHGNKNTVVVVPVSYFPTKNFRVFAGPGYEFKAIASNDKALLRVGMGYTFRINDRWTLAPEAINDFVDGGYNMWLVGVALGYDF